MSPCTLLVEREFATTLPAVACSDVVGDQVDESYLALEGGGLRVGMLPEMFSSAKDWARIPVTAVVRAPKIPITRLHFATGQLTQDAIGGRKTGARVARPEP